jgi:hypothetical protein
MSNNTDVERDDDSQPELYIVGLDETGNYVSRDKKTGKLLDSESLLIEKGWQPDWVRFFGPGGTDAYKTTSGDNFAFFESYDGQFVNGKREGNGVYKALDISEGKSTLEFVGFFENNLPVSGTLKFSENGQFHTTINGVFVNGLPDETKECEVVYSVYQNGEMKNKNVMKGLISFRNEKGVYPRDLEGKLNPNQPYNLLDVYLSFGFKLTGIKQTFPPPTEVGVFSSHAEKLSSLGGARSKKRSNHKRKYSHKN